jgi:glutaminyl-peptide cyclotransferase
VLVIGAKRLFTTGLPFFMLAAACVCTRSPDDKNQTKPTVDSEITDSSTGFSLNEALAKEDLLVFTSQPHPFGSPRNTFVADHLISRMGDIPTVKQEFSAQVPNPAAMSDTGGPMAMTLERVGHNVITTGALKPDADCIVLFGSHFDSKDIEGLTYVGANDSGSSSVALLQILAYFHENREKIAGDCDIGGIWFDGEEAVLPDWNDGLFKHPAKIQDNTYGSRHFVSNLSNCTRIEKPLKCMPEQYGGKAVVALVLLDMIGSPDIKISRDTNSSPSLLRALESGATALGISDMLSKNMTAIEDDHIPFRKAGIAAIDIIDFNNISYWHAAGDDLDKISYKSIGLASRLAIFTALSATRNPKVFAETSE